MKLEKLHLRWFRCFEELHIDFDEKLTVIIGENGAGKTAILDAIAIGFGRYLTKLPGVSGIGLKDNDIQIIENEKRALFTMIAWEAISIDGNSISWSSGRRRSKAVTNSQLKNAMPEIFNNFLMSGLKKIDEFALGIVNKVSENEDCFVPVIAYYGTNRAIRDEVHRRRNFRKSFSRFDALSGALDPDSRFKSAFEWFNAMEDLERREKESRRDFEYRHAELEVVRGAILGMFPDGYQSPRTEIRPLRFVIDRTNEEGKIETLRISELSDGYRVVLGLVMDLARRMAQANNLEVVKSLKASSVLEMPAIALIDEVDLHLHPRWQQKVIGDLMRTFPGTQFIVTTHSPQVLSTVKKDNVRVLIKNSDTANPPLAMTYGEPSGDVLHSVMMVDPQPPVAERSDLYKLTRLVDSGNYHRDESKALFNELKLSLGPTHPGLLKLERSIKRQDALHDLAKKKGNSKNNESD